MPTTLSRRDPARLSFQDGEVLVTPKDQDLYFINAEKATEACREVIKNEERVTRFKNDFLIPLQEWCLEHKDRVSRCYVAAPESAILPIYVIGVGESYDFDLTSLLSQLAFWFEDRGWSVHASQITKCEDDVLRGFFNLEHALQVYG